MKENKPDTFYNRLYSPTSYTTPLVSPTGNDQLMPGTTLRVDKIAETAEKLSQRINDRFPGAGLYKISRELVSLGEVARLQAPTIGRPIYPARIAVGVLIAALLATAATIIFAGFSSTDQFTGASLIDLLTALEAGTNEIVLIGLAILFLVNLETRIKRSRALRAIHELRSLAHVIDMHQLTKDPGYDRGDTADTESSPERTLSLSEIMRYLDYCSELLSIASKVAALYAQEMNDRVVLAAVSEVEALVAGLSQKIWQKLDIAEKIR